MEGAEAEEKEEEKDCFSFFQEQAGDGDDDDDDDGREDSSPSASPYPFCSARDLSFTSSTSSSSSFFSRSESLGIGDYPPISEYEEIPSLRWLSPFRSRRTAPTRTRMSSAYPSAPAGSAAYWEQLLPPDIEEILSRAVARVKYSSREDLYVRLCSSILIDKGNKCFALDRSTGKKCYLLSAKELRITWADEGCFFKWTSVPHSRFSRVARLPTVWWSGIHAEIDARALSPGTTYIACLVFGYSGRTFGQGLNSESQEATVAIGALKCKRSVFLQPNEQQRRRAGAGVPRRRGDGWLELEMGEFAVDNAHKEKKEVVRVSLERQDVRYDDESILALVVEGIEIRPKISPSTNPSGRGRGLLRAGTLFRRDAS